MVIENQTRRPDEPLDLSWLIGNSGDGVGQAQATLSILEMVVVGGKWVPGPGPAIVSQGPLINIPAGPGATVSVSWDGSKFSDVGPLGRTVHRATVLCVEPSSSRILDTEQFDLRVDEFAWPGDLVLYRGQVYIIVRGVGVLTNQQIFWISLPDNPDLTISEQDGITKLDIGWPYPGVLRNIPGDQLTFV